MVTLVGHLYCKFVEIELANIRRDLEQVIVESVSPVVSVACGPLCPRY
jgi:hypothetical protein